MFMHITNNKAFFLRTFFKRNTHQLLIFTQSAGENDLVQSLIGNNDASWIGGQYLPTLRKWAWTDGSAFNYDNWNKGEPNESGVRFLMFENNGGWNDHAGISLTLPYVCECG